MYASFCHGKPKTCTKAFLRELEIQSMTFPNNIITVGKNGSKNPKTKINGLRVWSSLLLENGQEQASRIPQKMWFLNALIGLSPFFITFSWKISDTAISWVHPHWQTSGAWPQNPMKQRADRPPICWQLSFVWKNQDLSLISWMQKLGRYPSALLWPLCTGCPREIQEVTGHSLFVDVLNTCQT